MRKRFGRRDGCRHFHSVIVMSLFAAAMVQATQGPAGARPQPDEFYFCNQWMGPLLGRTEQITRPHLKLLYEDTTEGVSRGRSWRGTPYQLGDKT